MVELTKSQVKPPTWRKHSQEGKQRRHSRGLECATLGDTASEFYPSPPPIPPIYVKQKDQNSTPFSCRCYYPTSSIGPCFSNETETQITNELQIKPLVVKPELGDSSPAPTPRI